MHPSRYSLDPRQRKSFVIDLSDIPPQPPIPKSSGRVKEGTSKYKGVCYNKESNKWKAQIIYCGSSRTMGNHWILSMVKYSAEPVFLLWDPLNFDSNKERLFIGN